MKKLIFSLFALSGLSGLVYQIVWARLLLLIFGNTTYSMVTVISVFMAGLAAGSLVFGILADKTKSHIKIWGVLELLIATSALLFSYLLPEVKELYLSASNSLNPELLTTLKFLLTALAIFPATFFMGGTLPLLIKSFSRYGTPGEEVSKLYFFNTLGAFVGTLLSAFVLIELLGLRGSVLAAILVNSVIGITALFLRTPQIQTFPQTKTVSPPKSNLETGKIVAYGQTATTFAVFAFFLSGAISLSYEILWTRLLIPTLGTFIYAFALILSSILFGIATGSIFAKHLLSKTSRPIFLLGILEFGIGVFAILSLLFLGTPLVVHNIIKLSITILPSAILMGATFPVVASLFHDTKTIGSRIGGAYAANTVGAILGPILTGFVFIPLIGTSNTLIILALVNIALGVVLVNLEKKKSYRVVFAMSGMFLLVVLLVKTNPKSFLENTLASREKAYEERGWKYKLFEDEVATTLAFAGEGSPKAKGLIIDGVQTTTLTTQTKLLAHLPLLIHKDPQNALVIAFGMGTTFRSALTYDIEVDAVELVPSVPKTFPLFHPDAPEVLKNPKGKIIINDGRNYLLSTKTLYDVIVVDPPPPINAAGTTVLYSKEFYQDGSKKLKTGGIFVQWFWYGAPTDDFKMLFKSFEEVFPYILVAVSPEGRGVFFLGSGSPIKINKDLVEKRYKDRVFADINEWQKTPYTTREILNLFVADKAVVKRFTQSTLPISDDHPQTEYFYLRHKLNPQPDISPDWVHPVDPKFLKKITL